MTSGSTTSWQIDGETMETVRDFIFLGSKTTADGECSHRIKRRLLKRFLSQLGRKAVRNLYAGQEATVRTTHGTMDWFQIGKEVQQGCISSPCLFNFYAEYIM